MTAEGEIRALKLKLEVQYKKINQHTHPGTKKGSLNLLQTDHRGRLSSQGTEHPEPGTDLGEPKTGSPLAGRESEGRRDREEEASQHHPGWDLFPIPFKFRDLLIHCLPLLVVSTGAEGKHSRVLSCQATCWRGEDRPERALPHHL